MSTQAAPPVVVVNPPQVVQAPAQETPPAAERERLTPTERAKRDAEEAEKIVSQYYADGIYTFPTSGFKVQIRELPEAAYQRFFFSGEPMPPPEPPLKKIKNDRGRLITTSDYNDEGYKAQVRIYETHNSNIRQKQAGDMTRYIYDKGAIIDLPEEWVEDYKDSLGPNEDASLKDMKYVFLVEEARTNAELKALTIAICGRDPLGRNVDDEDEDDE